MNSIAYLVLDEADRMFDMGLYPDIRNNETSGIIKKTDNAVQRDF
jgi:superfamily II DNA/RNA helicase